ncbi:hypothetical protein [Bradyrhizobium frederickii]|uniref:hypothetical protein n=1 Tax=Bradyrhizobium frederickii TaxID=2560054 RepID=UPI003D30FE0C
MLLASLRPLARTWVRRLHRAALPLRRLGALPARRARLLLTRTVVLAVRALRLLAGRGRPQLLLLRRLRRPRDAAERAWIGAAEVALLGDDLASRGLRQMDLADEAAVARDLPCGNRDRHRGKAHAARARTDREAAGALRQRA